MLTYVRTCQTHQSLLFYGLRSFCLNERVTTCDQRQWLVSSKTSFLYDISAGVSSLRCPQLRYGNWCLGRDQMEWDLPKLAEGFNMFQPFSACHCFGKMIHDDPSRLVYTCVTSVLRIQIFGTQDPQSLELEGSCCIILWKSTAFLRSLIGEVRQFCCQCQCHRVLLAKYAQPGNHEIIVGTPEPLRAAMDRGFLLFGNNSW